MILQRKETSLELPETMNVKKFSEFCAVVPTCIALNQFPSRNLTFIVALFHVLDTVLFFRETDL